MPKIIFEVELSGKWFEKTNEERSRSAIPQEE